MQDKCGVNPRNADYGVLYCIEEGLKFGTDKSPEEMMEDFLRNPNAETRARVDIAIERIVQREVALHLKQQNQNQSVVEPQGKSSGPKKRRCPNLITIQPLLEEETVDGEVVWVPSSNPPPQKKAKKVSEGRKSIEEIKAINGIKDAKEKIKEILKIGEQIKEMVRTAEDGKGLT